MDYRKKAHDYLDKAMEYVKKEFIPQTEDDPEYDLHLLVDETLDKRGDRVGFGNDLTFEADQALNEEVNEEEEDDD